MQDRTIRQIDETLLQGTAGPYIGSRGAPAHAEAAANFWISSVTAGAASIQSDSAAPCSTL